LGSSRAEQLEHLPDHNPDVLPADCGIPEVANPSAAGMPADAEV
jgi:hypothetical protein